MNSTTFGRAGEKEAEARLRKLGRHVIAGNYAADGGEIDIVTYHRGVVAFVEVKTRSSDTFGTPAEAVTPVKRARIRKAALGFIREQVVSGYVPVYSKLFGRMILKRVRRYDCDIAEVFMDRKLSVTGFNLITDAFPLSAES